MTKWLVHSYEWNYDMHRPRTKKRQVFRTKAEARLQVAKYLRLARAWFAPIQRVDEHDVGKTWAIQWADGRDLFIHLEELPDVRRADLEPLLAAMNKAFKGVRP